MGLPSFDLGGLGSSISGFAGGFTSKLESVGKMGQVEGKCEKPDLSAGGSKLTDKSASVRAKAMAFYACKYNEAIKSQAKTQFYIGLGQFIASLVFAYLQYKAARQLQDRLDDMWHELKGKGNELYDQWKDNSRPIEIKFLNEIRAREKAGYTVDYDTAINRSIVTARSEFSRARDKVDRETNIHCVGASRMAKRQLYMAEARAVVLATNSAIRYEEERKFKREKLYRDELFNMLNFYQARINQGITSLGGAIKAGVAKGEINPWDGFSTSIAQLSSVGNSYSVSQMSGFDLNHSNTQSSLVNNHF